MKLLKHLQVNTKKLTIILSLIVILFIATLLFLPFFYREDSIKNTLANGSEIYYLEDVSDSFLKSLLNPSYIVIYTNDNFVTSLSSVDLNRKYLVDWYLTEKGSFEMYNDQISDDFKKDFADEYSNLLKYNWENKRIVIKDIELKDKTSKDYSKLLDTRIFDYSGNNQLLNTNNNKNVPLYLDIDNDKAIKSIEVASGPGYASNDELLNKIFKLSDRAENMHKEILTDNLLHMITDIETFEVSLIDLGILNGFNDNLLDRYKRNQFYYSATPSLSLLYAQEIEEIGVVLLIQHNSLGRNNYLNKYICVYNQEEDGSYKLTYYEATEIYP